MKITIRYVFVLMILMITSNALAVIPIEEAPFWRNSNGVGKYHTGLQWHDLDNDGYLDMFLSNGNDMQMVRNYIFRNNNGNLPTYPTWQSLNSEYSGHCAIGDINYDGYPEFVVSNFLGSGGFPTPNNQEAYVNNAGTMEYPPWWSSTDSTWSFSCALGDLDGDGDLDLVYACGEGYYGHLERQRIYYNIGGVFEAAPSWQSSGVYSMIDVTLGDVDNDGDLDVAFCGDNTRVLIYENNGGIISTTPTWQSNDIQSSNTLAFGDIDGDGWLDLAVADNDQLGGSGQFKVYHNNGGTLGTTPYWQSSTGGYGSSVSWCDLDYDGDMDLATGRWWSQVMIYENTGTTLTTTPVWYSASNHSSVIEEIQFADIDRDGVGYYKDDIAASSGRHVYYVKRKPLHSVDSVFVDNVKLGFDEFCYSLVDGWVSVGVDPSASMDVFYQWSYKPDMGVSNWDSASFVFANTFVADFIAGNADGQGIIDIDDVVYLIDYIFGSGPAPDPIRSGDADASGDIDIDDVVYLINYIFGGGEQPYYP